MEGSILFCNEISAEDNSLALAKTTFSKAGLSATAVVTVAVSFP